MIGEDTLVLVYSKTCSHCIKFMEIWKEVDVENKLMIEWNELKNYDDILPSQLKGKSIGVPLIFVILNNGQKEIYYGNRDKKSIENFYNKKVLKSIDTIQDCFSKALKKHVNEFRLR